jgi:hypothetical protein
MLAFPVDEAKTSKLYKVDYLYSDSEVEEFTFFPGTPGKEEILTDDDDDARYPLLIS